MIGTTLKVGFDSTAVNRGLGGLGGKFRGLMGRIGVGAMERVGHRMTDLMGRIAMAIPDALTETMDWAGNLTDMATATDMPIERLIHLEEMFRLAGVSAKESGAVVSRFMLNIKKGANEGGPAVDSVRALGLNIQELAAMRPEMMFEAVASAMANFTGEASSLEEIMANLFGAKLGYQQLKLFKDFNAVSARAAMNVGGLSRALGGKLAYDLDAFGDALGRMENVKRSLSSIALSEFFKLAGADSADKFFDAFDPEKIRKPIADFMGEIRKVVVLFAENGIMPTLSNALRNVGREIGKGISDSIKESIGIGTGKGFSFKGISIPFKKPSSAQSSVDLSKTESLLQDIRQRVGVAKFA